MHYPQDTPFIHAFTVTTVVPEVTDKIMSCSPVYTCFEPSAVVMPNAFSRSNAKLTTVLAPGSSVYL